MAVLAALTLQRFGHAIHGAYWAAAPSRSVDCVAPDESTIPHVKHSAPSIIPGITLNEVSPQCGQWRRICRVRRSRAAIRSQASWRRTRYLATISRSRSTATLTSDTSGSIGAITRTGLLGSKVAERRPLKAVSCALNQPCARSDPVKDVIWLLASASIQAQLCVAPEAQPEFRITGSAAALPLLASFYWPCDAASG
jgi:hypothetical protein